MSRRRKSPTYTVEQYDRDKRAGKFDPKPDPAKPLPRPLHEAFAQEFSREADPLQAALRAGYSPRFAGQAWPLLLQRQDVQARLNALRSGVEIPAAQQKDVLNALFRDAFMDFSSLYEKCPRTGSVRFNLSRATPRQLNTLEFRHEITESNGRTTTRTIVTPPNRATALRIIASRMGLYDPDDEAREVSPWKRIIMGAQGTPLRPRAMVKDDDE